MCVMFKFWRVSSNLLVEFNFKLQSLLLVSFHFKTNTGFRSK